MIRPTVRLMVLHRSAARSESVGGAVTVVLVRLLQSIHAEWCLNWDPDGLFSTLYKWISNGL